MGTEGAVTIAWLGHACFRVESGGYAVVFDPYEDGCVPGLGPVRTCADEVLCSHAHPDHNAAGVVTVAGGKASPFRVVRINTWHDDARGAKRGPNTIHILDNGSLRVAHLGDLGCELEETQKEELRGLDAVMVPVGGFYTIDAAQAKKLMDEIQPRVVIPMHYRSDEYGFGYDVLGTVAAFTDLCEAVVEYPDNELEVTARMEPQVAVLRYIRK